MNAEPSPTSAPVVSSPFCSPPEENCKPPHVRIVPSLEAPGQSLIFSVIEMDLENTCLVKIGRFTDRRNIPNRVTFRSKVVSRAHAEMWSEGRKIFLRDTKSSSGTFLNNMRLSPPGQESKAVEIKDGDIVQLGVDYQGGTEEIYRSVKMKFEVNRTWQQRANPFSLNALNNLRSLGGTANTMTRSNSNPAPTEPAQACEDSVNAQTSSNAPIGPPPAQVEVEECCICLFAIAPFQALFLAPCSHTYHYKCIRPLLTQNHPAFSCPICRTYADLDANVAVEAEEVLEMYGLGKNSDHPATASITNVRPPSLRAMASTTSLTRYGVRQNSITDGECHVRYPIDPDPSLSDSQSRTGLAISQTITSSLNNATTRDAMARTLVENSRFGVSERMRVDSDSSEDNILQDDDRRQTMIQRDDEDLDVLEIQSDEDRRHGRELIVPVATTSLPSTTSTSPLSPSSSRFLQRRPSATGIVGKLKNVILDKSRLSYNSDDSSPAIHEASFQDEVQSTGSGTQPKSDTLHHQMENSHSDSTSYPNLRRDLASPQSSLPGEGDSSR